MSISEKFKFCTSKIFAVKYIKVSVDQESSGYILIGKNIHVTYKAGFVDPF